MKKLDVAKVGVWLGVAIKVAQLAMLIAKLIQSLS